MTRGSRPAPAHRSSANAHLPAARSTGNLRVRGIRRRRGQGPAGDGVSDDDGLALVGDRSAGRGGLPRPPGSRGWPPSGPPRRPRRPAPPSRGGGGRRRRRRSRRRGWTRPGRWRGPWRWWRPRRGPGCRGRGRRRGRPQGRLRLGRRSRRGGKGPGTAPAGEAPVAAGPAVAESVVMVGSSPRSCSRGREMSMRIYSSLNDWESMPRPHLRGKPWAGRPGRGRGRTPAAEKIGRTDCASGLPRFDRDW